MDVIEREKTNEVRVTNNACVGVVCINVRAWMRVSLACIQCERVWSQWVWEYEWLCNWNEWEWECVCVCACVSVMRDLSKHAQTEHKQPLPWHWRNRLLLLTTGGQCDINIHIWIQITREREREKLERERESHYREFHSGWKSKSCPSDMLCIRTTCSEIGWSSYQAITFFGVDDSSIMIDW